MKKLTILMLVLSGLLSGCIAYDEPYRDRPMHRSGGDRDYDHHREDRGRDHERDRDRDRDYR